MTDRPGRDRRPRHERPARVDGPAVRERDDVLGAALRTLPVPGHRPGFWDRLEARLLEAPDDEVGAGGVGAGGAVGGPAGEPGLEELTALDDPAGAPPPRSRPPRRALTVAAAALLVVAVAAALLSRQRQPTDEVVMSAPPPASEAPVVSGFTGPMVPATVHAEVVVRDGGAAPATFDLVTALDGSYRWTAGDGSLDVAYDAAAGRIVRVERGDRARARVTKGVPPGGPDRLAAGEVPPPLAPLGAFVVSLGLDGDERVEELVVAGRPAWRYDGPLAPDLLGEDSADHVVAEVDRETGVILSLAETRPSGAAGTSFETTSIELGSEVSAAAPGDRQVFQLEPPPDLDVEAVDLGFRPASPEEVAAAVGYVPLVPGAVPAGFVLDQVVVNPGAGLPVGPEGMVASSRITVMQWRAGGYRLTITLRPAPDVADDPYGREGVAVSPEPLSLTTADGAPFEAALVLAAPYGPHLWGRAAGLLVTVDGELSTPSLRTVAESLRPAG